MKKIIFSKPCTKGFIGRLGPKKKIEIFSELFFLALHPPQAVPPLGDYTPPICRAKKKFSKKKSQKKNLLKHRHMGDFFGRLGPEKKYFSTFFGPDLWGTHFGTPFWTRCGPILDRVVPHGGELQGGCRAMKKKVPEKISIFFLP